jgi:hypothetical protein
VSIDTAAKSASATAFLLPFYNGVITDGTIDIDETMAASWMYNGITPAELVLSSTETIISFILHIDQAKSFILHIDQVKSFILNIDQTKSFNLEL